MPAVDAQVFIMEEGTPGTLEATPGAGDVIDFHTFSVRKAGTTFQQRPVVRAHQDRVPGKRGHGVWFEGDFATEVKACVSGFSLRPEIGNILKASGFSQTEDAGVSWTYALLDDPNAAATEFSTTVTKEMSADGIFVQSHGARFGELVFSGNSEGQLELSGKWAGGYNLPTDQGTLTSPTYRTGNPLVVLDSSAPIALADGYQPILSDVSISVGNSVKVNRDMALAANHFVDLPTTVVRDASSPVTMALDIQLVDISAHDFWSKWNAASIDTTTRAVKWSDGTYYMQASLENIQYQQLEVVTGVPNMYRVVVQAGQSSASSLSLKFG